MNLRMSFGNATLLATAISMNSCSSTSPASQAAKVAPRKTAGVAEKKNTEIVLIGSHHLALFLNPRYSPAHLRALLTKIHPDFVCIEALSDWEWNGQPIPTFPQEQYATLTWAHATKVPVYGVDLDELTSGEWEKSIVAWQQARKATKVEQRWANFQKYYRGSVVWEATEAYGESDTDLDHMHSPKGAEEAESTGTKDLSPDERAANDTRDDRIAEKILRVASKHPAKRIAVVLGAFHYARQIQRLRTRPTIRVIPTTEFLPLSKSEIEAGWYRDDAIVLLGANLDSWRIPGAPQSRNHQRSKELLDRLSVAYPNSPTTRYYRAKWRLLLEDLGQAKKILEVIVEENTQATLPYEPNPFWCWPPLSRIDHKARFALATVYDLEGRHDKASMYYRQLLEIKPPSLLRPIHFRRSYHDLSSYLNSLISEPYRGGIWEIFRAQESKDLE